MFTWKTILAALLYLQAPGKTIYSTVSTTEDGPIAIVDEVNGTKAYRLLEEGEELPNQCKQKGNVACSRPKKRNVIYNLVNLDVEWSRHETYDEGVARYATIAKAIDGVLKEGEWNFPTGRSWRFLVAIAYHESGFRRDIHIGRGSWAVGDCSWRRGKDDKRVRIKGTCKSHGLFQSLFAKPKKTRLFGFKATDIIGDDLETTKRAVTVAAKHLDRLHTYCSRTGPRPYTACVFATYGGLSDTRDKRVQQRVKTYNKIKRAPTKLDEYVASLVDPKDSSAGKNIVASAKE